jgi:hypothetical protein
MIKRNLKIIGNNNLRTQRAHSKYPCASHNLAEWSMSMHNPVYPIISASLAQRCPCLNHDYGEITEPRAQDTTPIEWTTVCGLDRDVIVGSSSQSSPVEMSGSDARSAIAVMYLYAR